MRSLGGRLPIVGLAVAGVVAAGLLAVGAATVADVGPQRTLVVEADDGTELLSVPVEENSTVVLAYTHSVEKTPVRDVYAVRDGQLVMTRTEFRSFGAGLPSHADVERTDDGGYLYRPPAEPRDELHVATGRVAGHELVVDDTKYDLVELADAGSVRVSVTTRIRT